MSQVNPNSIEEMEVITAGAGVEFSRAQGGFARIIQKQGSNEFEGVVRVLLPFRARSTATARGDYSNLDDPGFDWYQPSVQVSGPIVKDKLWYRLSHEYIKQRDPGQHRRRHRRHRRSTQGDPLRPAHLAGLAAQQAGLPVPVRPAGDRQLRHQLADAAGIVASATSGAVTPGR